jgi:hypothetical protein
VVEAAQFVEAEDVIGVRVRIKNGVDAVEAMAQRLRPQVRGRVNEQPESW